MSDQRVWKLEPGTVSEAFVRGAVVEGAHTSLLWGPFGSGKSVTAVHLAWMLSRMQPKVRGVRRSRWAFVRNTSDQLRQTTLNTWWEWFPDNEFRKWYSRDAVVEWKEGDFEMEVMFLPLDRPNDVRKLLSLELTGAFFNEGREIEVAIWDGVDGRLGRFPPKADLMEVVQWSDVTDGSSGSYVPQEVGRYWRMDAATGLLTDEPVYVKRGVDGVLRSSAALSEEEAERRGERWPGGGVKWALAPWSGLLADSNPSATDDWLWKQFFERAIEDEAVGWKYRGYRQPPGLLKSADGRRWEGNPGAENVQNLVPGYYKNMAVGKAEPWVRMYCCGEPVTLSDGKPVFPQFDVDWHVCEFGFDARLPVYAAWDFGVGGQACLLAQVSERGQVRVFDEFVGEMGTLLFARDVVKEGLAKWRGARYELGWGDPAGANRAQTDERSSMELINDAYVDMAVGLPFKTYPARTNALQARLDAVNWFLSGTVLRRTNSEPTGPKIVVHPRCKVLVAGLSGRYEYRRVQTSEQKWTEVPAKNRWSHPADALQYLCMGLLSHMEWGQKSEDDDGGGKWEHRRARGLSGY